jgi:Tfp pilus assembly protein PilV
MKYHRQAGVTLPEVIVMMLLLVIVSILTNISLRIMNSMKREGSRMQASQDAHIFLYNLAKEVRNAKEILSISPATVQFTTYDFSKGFDGGTDDNGVVVGSDVLFDDAKITTITYTCTTSPKGAVMQRVEVRAGVTRTTNYFQDSIVIPSNDVDNGYDTAAYADESSYIFFPNQNYVCPDVPASGKDVDCTYLRVRLHMRPGFFKRSSFDKNPLDYSIDVNKRSYAG